MTQLPPGTVIHLIAADPAALLDLAAAYEALWSPMILPPAALQPESAW
jgi:hypothetical protein